MLFPQERAEESTGGGPGGGPMSIPGAGSQPPSPPPPGIPTGPPPAGTPTGPPPSGGGSFNAGASADAFSAAGLKARSTFVRDPGSWVAAAASITVLILILAGLVLALSSYAGISGGAVFSYRGGARARLLELASFGTLEVAAILLVAAVLARAVPPQEPAHFRRLALLGVAALSAAVALAALFRGLLVLTFIGRTASGSFHEFLSAMAVIPIAGAAAVLASALVESPGPHHR